MHGARAPGRGTLRSDGRRDGRGAGARAAGFADEGVFGRQLQQRWGGAEGIARESDAVVLPLFNEPSVFTDAAHCHSACQRAGVERVAGGRAPVPRLHFDSHAPEGLHEDRVLQQR